MALKDILQKIEADATLEIKAVQDEAAATVATITATSDATYETAVAEGQSMVERRASKITERIISRARHNVQFIEEGIKRTHLDGIFTAFKSKLEAMSDVEYAKFVDLKFSQLVSTDGTFTVGGPREAETRAQLIKQGVKADAIKNSPEKTISGGFIFSTNETEQDFSFERIVEIARNTEELTVSHTLFSSAVTQ